MKLCALSVLVLLGCTRGPVTPAPSNADSPKSSPVVSVAQPTPEKKNDAPVKDIAKPHDNPQLIRNNERGIIRGIVRGDKDSADAVVWLKPLHNTTLQSPPIERVRLRVEQDEFRPHVLLAQKGSVLELRTVEPRADFQASGAATFSETIERGMQRTFPLSTPGLIEVRSQLHPQRAPAYLWVLDGVPGVLTGSDGTFRLPPVPPGEFELTLWHAKQSSTRVPLSLKDNEGVEVRWTLTKPSNE